MVDWFTVKSSQYLTCTDYVLRVLRPGRLPNVYSHKFDLATKTTGDTCISGRAGDVDDHALMGQHYRAHPNRVTYHRQSNRIRPD